jgi:hypothetical protein
MRYRDRAARLLDYFAKPSRLMKVTGFGCALICSCAFWIMLPGGGATGRGGAIGVGIAPVNRNKLSVLSAAPVRIIGIPDGIRVSEKLKAPPPYTSAEAVIKQSLHAMPSICCRSPLISIPDTGNCSGGTIGTAFGKVIVDGGNCWSACTRVDVWMDESAIDPNIAPTINDPNARAILVIKPPSNGNSNCSEWTYNEMPGGYNTIK